MKQSSAIRNLIIFSAVAISCGWFGVWINQILPSPSPQQSLGILVWILAPLFTVLILRGLGKDGWQDFGLRINLKGNLGWYIFAFLLYPVTITFTLLLASLFKVVSFDGFIAKGFPALLQVIAFGFSASLVKNIGEEFSWRGYLTPRLQALGLSNVNNHLLTSVIWGLWHIPYWLFFIGVDNIKSYTDMSVMGFIGVGLLALFPISFVFGELRLKTNSVWPAYIAHNMTNAITAQLIINGFIQFKHPSAMLFFAPGTDGIVMLVIFFGLWFWMVKRKS